ncbi:DEAD/DEAH box helicase [Mucilaginibacter sp. RS28]|uniref:DEAD-box ATP-dependent RNA helicase RhpA n=1 Tax=Mucilaginibacter straminoryzae TaxID=2932774 RepID=A0A9X2BAJ0_9SPHI|nr:DEAD/DEAH box helicase [Mucilaginibacter straminoryzae]MCJ8211441.1 DEAD/DEAH box helicase [Mucilaginibacter straminoryzae]
MTFQELNLIEPILRALKTEGYTTPTPIQAQAIPLVLQRRDLLGCAQTGTGKTAAFSIPLLQILSQERTNHKEPKAIKALILTPTRELAIQIDESLAAYGRHTGLKHMVIFGGVSQNPQTDALRRGIDILVATPGRLLDLMNQGYVHLSQLKVLILDEADRMLDMGFVHDVKRIIAKVPAKRQTLFFSATMPKEIQQLADTILNNPAKVEVTPVSSTADTINQSVFFVDKGDKRALLNHILKDKSIERVLVFTRTKHGADKVVKDLNRNGITAEAIHGNKSQNARQRALNNFKSSTTRVLVATDIAARGIDVDELTHVIQYELPEVPETYVHRIGRTGRAGANGIAFAFCDEEEKDLLKDIHKLIAKTIPVDESHPYPLKQLTPQERIKKDLEKSKVKQVPSSSERNKQKRGNGNRRWGNKRPAKAQ